MLTEAWKLRKLQNQNVLLNHLAKKYFQKVRIFLSKLFENFLLRGIYFFENSMPSWSGHVILTQQKVKSPKKCNKSKFNLKKTACIVCVVCTVCMLCSLHFNMQTALKQAQLLHKLMLRPQV